MNLIETLKNELKTIENDIWYIEENDTAYLPEYTKLCKQRSILKKTIHKLERLEVHSND